MAKDPNQIAADLRDRIRGEVFADILHRVAFSTDASSYRIVPQCVVAPRDGGDVEAVVKYAAREGLPVAPRGAGSGVAGESLCAGLVLDMTRHLTRILDTSDDGATVTCEPGVVLDDLNKHLARYGRKIGPDPSSANRATVGGCLANNATGAHSLQYGHMSEHVEAIEAVLADGTPVLFTNAFDVEKAGGRRADAIARECWSLLTANRTVIDRAVPATKRNRSGYNIASVCHDHRIDLARLLAGSEGTLAIFTRITLRTVPLPNVKGLLQLEFDSLDGMARAVPTIVKTAPAACELMDRTLIHLAIDQLPQYRDILPAEAAAVLLIEHVGDTEAEVRERIEVTDLAVGRHAAGRTIITSPADQARVWKSRKDAGPLLYRKRRREHPAEFMEDASVDHTRLAEYIDGLQKIQQKYGTTMSFFGHAGDGELHLRPYLDLSNPRDVEKMRAMADEVFSLVWSLGGSISGEHADGLLRAGFVRRQYGDAFYEILRKVKMIFDPAGLMNPGKILNDDPDVMVKNLRRARRILPEKARSEMHFADQELELEFEQCYGCGLCLTRDPSLRMCPVYRALGEELGSSRAKANLLHYWATGQLDEKDFESPEFRRFLDLCVNCKMCERECPSGVRVSTLMAAARAEYVRRKGLRRTEFALSHNRYLSVLGSVLAPVSNLFLRLPPFRWAMDKTVGLDRRRRMPTFQRGSFVKAAQKHLAAVGPLAAPVDKVAYFVDSYANSNDHALGYAVLDVLRYNDVEVIVPAQRPAPLPAIVYGDVKTARRDLAYNVARFAQAARDGYKIVCSEPSAALCLQQEMRHYVCDDGARRVSENTWELMNYLADLRRRGRLKAPTESVPGEFVYHLPCHLCAVGDETVTLRLLGEHFGVNVRDLRAGCCGLAGTFGMQKKNYDLADRISESLRNAIAVASSRNVLTECAACRMQIEHLGEVVVTHPVKLLARAYGMAR
ncbi:MAG TPA: FAD-linked oxidase C-terminal domain-containing protein [Sedimentisphaerales bacterium]|nr:FAD-linked oxidase C-terminal domain-containing protein [Sedimentisphaerales bacterium]HRS11105.1 FAD-linked oxidase C-terminal domain-containing protein [Sedimentisphaerales bacterium]HRV47686.1 FAD-linked oxidase C-terminal domain-containing protein [Sedimentisphaerales bacterium]